MSPEGDDQAGTPADAAGAADAAGDTGTDGAATSAEAAAQLYASNLWNHLRSFSFVGS